MSQIELINHQIRGMMVYGASSHPVHDVMTCFSTVIDAAQDVHKIDPISQLDWTWHGDRYDFAVTMEDDRVWAQTVRPGDRIVWMTYNVPAEFSSLSMASAQILRKELIKASIQCQVAKIELVWL